MQTTKCLNAIVPLTLPNKIFVVINQKMKRVNQNGSETKHHLCHLWSWSICAVHTLNVYFFLNNRSGFNLILLSWVFFPDTMTLWVLLLLTHNSGNLRISTPCAWVDKSNKVWNRDRGPDSALLAEAGSGGAWPKNASSPQVPPTGNACPDCWRPRWWKRRVC